MLLDLLYSEDIDIKDLEKYFLASSQGQAPGFSPKNFITGDKSQRIILHSSGAIRSYRKNNN